MHEAPSFCPKRKANGEILSASVPRRSLWVRCSKPVLNDLIILVDLDRTNTNRKAGDFSPAFFGIELAVGKYDARANDLAIAAHFAFPSARMVQTSWLSSRTLWSLS